MTAEREIHDILITRDIDAFVARDWDQTRHDFDPEAFTGYSGEGGTIRLTFPSLGSYRDSWLDQSAMFSGMPPELIRQQLGSAQRIERLDLAAGKALAIKVFDGWVDRPDGQAQRLDWTSFYFLTWQVATERWLVTGFVGYLPSDRSLQ